MAGEPVEFLLEAVLHVPRAPDLDLCARILQRVIPHDATSPQNRPVLRGLTAEYGFPEGTATVYGMLTVLTDQIPPRWRRADGGHVLSVTASCHRVPRARAEPLARVLYLAMARMARRMDATAGYVDLGARQDLPDPPPPWATVRRVHRPGWAWVGLDGTRLTRHRSTAFPDGLGAGRLGFPPKPRQPEPACLLVAGAVLDDAPEAASRAREAGLRVWRVEFQSKPPRTVAGLLVASLDLSQWSASVEPTLAAQMLEDARERLGRAGLGADAGLLLARVMDDAGGP